MTEEPSAAELHHFALAECIAEDNPGEVLRVGKRKTNKRPSDSRDSSPAH